MKNKLTNIVCNRSADYLVREMEKFIDNRMKDGWDILTIQDSIIIATQNKLAEWNY